MKKRVFLIEFLIGGLLRIEANNEEQASILAQADRIRAGKVHDILSIEEEK